MDQKLYCFPHHGWKYEEFSYFPFRTINYGGWCWCHWHFLMTVFQLKSFLPLTDWRDRSDDDDDDDDDTKHQQSLKIISRTFQQITGRGFFFVRKLFSVMSPLRTAYRLYRSMVQNCLRLRVCQVGPSAFRSDLVVVWGKQVDGYLSSEHSDNNLHDTFSIVVSGIS